MPVEAVAHRRREDRSEHRDAHGDAYLAEGRVDAGGHAGTLRFDHPDRRRRQRRIHEPGADAGDEQPGDEVGPSAVATQTGHEEQPDANQP